MSNKPAIFRCIIFLFSSFIAIETVEAQLIRQFTAEPVQAGARATALADAYVSDPQDVNSVYWNPASLAFLKTFSITANSIKSWDNTTLKTTVAVPYRVSDNNTVALGAAANYQGYFSFFNLDLGYARNLSPTVSAGIFMNIGVAESRSDELWRGSGSIGIFYLPSPSISYAFVYKGIGKDISYSYDGVKEELNYINPNRAFLIGTTFWFPSQQQQHFLSIALAAEKTIGYEGFSSKIGIELYPLPFVAARFGILSRPSVATGRFGFGFLVSRFRLDYAISSSTAEERIHQISFAVRI